MSTGFQIASFIGEIGPYERYFVIRTNFDYRMSWTCCACGNIHSGRWVGKEKHRNPYPTSCYKCGTGHLVFIGGAKPN